MNITKSAEKNGVEVLDVQPDDYLVKVLDLIQQLEQFDRLIHIAVNCCCSSRPTPDEMEDFRTLIATYCQVFPPVFEQLCELVRSDSQQDRHLDHLNELDFVREYLELAGIGLRRFPANPKASDLHEFYVIAIAHRRIVEGLLSDFKQQVIADLQPNRIKTLDDLLGSNSAV
ncbi:MAG: hypothetical protein F6K32_10920 [Desertifilum sp. SIO1I2]|nr:hypothetical protein [Desertifilum sp. SIO1I2]